MSSWDPLVQLVAPRPFTMQECDIQRRVRTRLISVFSWAIKLRSVFQHTQRTPVNLLSSLKNCLKAVHQGTKAHGYLSWAEVSAEIGCWVGAIIHSFANRVSGVSAVRLAPASRNKDPIHTTSAPFTALQRDSGTCMRRSDEWIQFPFPQASKSPLQLGAVPDPPLWCLTGYANFSLLTALGASVVQISFDSWI